MPAIKKQEFLIELQSRGKLNEILPVLSWLLKGDFFVSGTAWSSDAVARFIKQFKRNAGLAGSFEHKGGLDYPKTPSSR